MRGLPILFSCLIAALQLNAQNGFTLSALKLDPNRTFLNPAFGLSQDFYLNLPLISSTEFSYRNNRFAYRDLVLLHPDNNKPYFDFENLLGTFQKAAYLESRLSTTLLGSGWKQGRWDISIAANEHLVTQGRIPEPVARLAIKGNAPYLGEEVDLGELLFRGTHYREYSLGISRDFFCDFRLGLRLKYLYGMENFDIGRSRISLFTDPISYELSGHSDIYANSSGAESFAPDSLRWLYYHFQRGNHGMAADMGAQWKINKAWQIDAAVLDLGSIRWKNELKNYTAANKQFRYFGIPLGEFIAADTLNKGIGPWLDSLRNTFGFVESANAYRSNIPGRISAGAEYQKDGNRFRAQLNAAFFKGNVYPALGLVWSKALNENIELAASWSAQNNKYSNFGAGIVIRVAQMQLSVSTDNIPGIVLPYKSRTVGIRFGITFVNSGKEPDQSYCDRDRDGIPNRKDDCPDHYAPYGIKGCPDSDEDGIPDKDDACPYLAGIPLFKGCPDTDNDSIPDSEDRCPDSPGLTLYNGCPDTDGDGIPDPDDECPYDSGSVERNGCPDSDGDGVIDRYDQCPAVPGPESNGGCPEVEDVYSRVLQAAVENLEFETGKAIILASSFADLDNLAALLIENPEYQIIISGHTDNRGSESANIELSKRRAQAVEAYLLSKKVDAGQIKTYWYGSARPKVSNDTEAGRKANRRVDMSLLKKPN